MPKGPKGEKRPSNVIGAAIKVAKIATGEIEEDTEDALRRASHRESHRERRHLDRPATLLAWFQLGLAERAPGPDGPDLGRPVVRGRALLSAGFPLSR